MFSTPGACTTARPHRGRLSEAHRPWPLTLPWPGICPDKVVFIPTTEFPGTLCLTRVRIRDPNALRGKAGPGRVNAGEVSPAGSDRAKAGAAAGPNERGATAVGEPPTPGFCQAFGLPQCLAPAPASSDDGVYRVLVKSQGPRRYPSTNRRVPRVPIPGCGREPGQ
jgi:hypothetical protein